MLAASVSAQPVTTGAITGRVLNPSSGEYIRNAEVRVQGTSISVVTEDGGYYHLNNVPSGEAILIASYTGHQTVTTTVTVAAGSTSTHDFELAPVLSRSERDEVVKLGAYVVESEREGQAKAISEQKTAVNVKTVVASDNFGDIAEGNIGEFLKFMPGITLDYVETDTRAARIGGMEARYGYVTLDGGTIANTSTGSFGDDTRQFEFEAVSINNIETIEVNRTLMADMPGDAPAGTINLRSRSALDRKTPSFNYMLGMIGNQYEHTLSSTPRHDDATHPKTRPTGGFDYSSGPLPFLGGKLGITLNGQFTNVFKEQFRHSETYDYTSTTAQARGTPLITAINFKDGPKMTEKSSGGVKVDYEPFRALRVFLASSYTYFSDEISNRNLNFRVSAANIDPSSTMTRIIALPTTNNGTRIEQTGSTGNKKTDTTNLSSGFTYRARQTVIDGLASYSRARQQNGGYHLGAVDAANLQLTRIGWIAERPNDNSPSWYFTQTAGGSWYDLNNYGANDTQSNNITESRSRSKAEQYVVQINARYSTAWRHPVTFKTGLYEQVSTRHRDQEYSLTETFLGPTGNQLQARMPASIASFWIAKPWGSNILPLPVPDKSAMYALVRDHPEYFSYTATNQGTDLDNILSSPQSNQEQIGATYVMATTRFRRLFLYAGLRLENTRTITEVPSVVPIGSNPYALKDSKGNPIANFASSDYVRYRYSQGTNRKDNRYNDLFPSASAQYQFTPNLDLKLGYSAGIKRPPLGRTAGLWDFNSAETIITIPNPNLTPARSNKFSALLEYYWDPAGTFSIHVFETQIKNDSVQTDPMPSSALGLDNDPIYAPYEFITYENIPGTRKIRGLELNYAQQLRFLPGPLRGTSIFATYSRYTSNPRPGGFVPQNASAGVNYRYRKFNAKIAGTWTDDIYTGANTVSKSSKYFPGDREVLLQRYIVDVGLGYNLSPHAEFRIDGRNALNSGKTWKFADSDGRIRQMERYGGQWTISYRGHY